MRRRGFLGALAGAAFAGQPPFHFVDVAKQAGLVHPVVYGGEESKKYILETNGCGVAFYDYDGDGWPDILAGTGSRLDRSDPQATIRLYRNNRDGTFTDVTGRAGLKRTAWVSGIAIGDYDNDGREDLFLSCWGQNILYHNNGDGTFTDVTREAGLLAPKPRWGAGCTWIDYNRDGLLDLFVGTYLEFDPKTVPLPGAGENCMWKGIAVNCGPKGLPTGRNALYRNNGDGTFTDVSQESGIAAVTGRYAMTALAYDFDGDGRQDLYVACDSTASILYKNRGDGTFVDVALERGVAYNEDGREQAGMGVALGDTRNLGRLDLFKTHFADDTPVLYRALEDGHFEDATSAAGLNALTRYVGWGAGFADFDNDGRVDLLFVNGNVYPEVERHFEEYKYRNPRVVLRNRGDGVFEDVSAVSGPGISARHSSRGCAFGDFDNDGDVDVLVMNMGEAPSLLRNDTAGQGNWLKVKLVGSKSNRSGIGASVLVTGSGRRQRQVMLSQSSFYSQNDARLHFGLGEAKSAESIEVRWPSGMVQVLKGVRAGQTVEVRER
ncbi:MAG: CRTAC1 family protein [Bryobacteraceae bacterium]|nr:CRTAC1 family protein [Bryobacteraceae bacterium]